MQTTDFVIKLKLYKVCNNRHQRCSHILWYGRMPSWKQSSRIP